MIGPGPIGVAPHERRRGRCRGREDLHEEIRWLREEIRWLRELVELQGDTISPLLDIIKDRQAKDEKRRSSQ
jgi:hypothetical protein